MIIVNDRYLNIPSEDYQIGFVGDNSVETRQFEITDTTLFNFDFKLDIQSGSNVGISDLVKTIATDKIVLMWEVKQEDIPNNGLLYVQLRAFDNTDLIWHSEKGIFLVGDSINATDYFPSPLPSEFEQMEQRVTAKHTDVVAKHDMVVADTIIVEADMQEVVTKHGEVLAKALEVIADRIRAENAADNSEESETTATQAMSDLLAMMGSDIATLTGGKLTPSQIPALSINDTFTVANTTEMLALTAQRGDVALIIPDDIVTDSYILADDDATILTNWKKLGVSYVANAGHAVTADTATDSTMINGHRLVTMTQAQFDVAVKETETLYLVSVV